VACRFAGGEPFGDIAISSRKDRRLPVPIVSEHPRSIDVIKRLSDQCDAELEAFVNEYAERRRAYHAAVEARRAGRRERATRPEEIECRELIALLEVREARTDELRDELQVMTKELAMLKRELRRARRSMLEAGVVDASEPDYAVPTSAPGVPSMPSIQEYAGRVRDGGSFAWLKPWLRGFLPSSA
jgi:hypothetical protein